MDPFRHATSQRYLVPPHDPPWICSPSNASSFLRDSLPSHFPESLSPPPFGDRACALGFASPRLFFDIRLMAAILRPAPSLHTLLKADPFSVSTHFPTAFSAGRVEVGFPPARFPSRTLLLLSPLFFPLPASTRASVFRPWDAAPMRPFLLRIGSSPYAVGATSVFPREVCTMLFSPSFDRVAPFRGARCSSRRVRSIDRRRAPPPMRSHPS